MSETVQVTVSLTLKVDVQKWAAEYGIDPSPDAVLQDVQSYYDLSSLQDALIPAHLRSSVTAVRQGEPERAAPDQTTPTQG